MEKKAILHWWMCTIVENSNSPPKDLPKATKTPIRRDLYVPMFISAQLTSPEP